jgi:hypothetical protein
MQTLLLGNHFNVYNQIVGLYKIVVSIGNAKITPSWNMFKQRTLLPPSYWAF